MPLTHPHRLVAGSLATFLVLAGAASALPARAAVPSRPFVSEIHYDCEHPLVAAAGV
jgi:hypothetical protein